MFDRPYFLMAFWRQKMRKTICDVRALNSIHFYILAFARDRQRPACLWNLVHGWIRLHLGLCVSESRLVFYNLLVLHNFLISTVGLCSHSISWLHPSPLYTPAKTWCCPWRSQPISGYRNDLGITTISVCTGYVPGFFSIHWPNTFYIFFPNNWAKLSH